MIISITGSEGSGKSTLAKKLSEKLKMDHYDNGAIRRQKAKDRGLTLAEYNKLGETDPSTDREVDEFQKSLGLTKDNLIIEGRLAWHFIPHSLKIFLDVDKNVAAERVLKDLQKNHARNEDKNIKTVADVLLSLENRKKSDSSRYLKYYGIKNVNDKNNFDFYLDTTKLTRTQVMEKVLDFVRDFRRKR